MAMKFDPFQELDRMAQALRGDGSLRGMPMDLYRQGDNYILAADLPGIDPGSIDVDVDGQLLTIRAQRTLHGVEGVKWLTRERESGSFLRQLNLGQGIDTERISAQYTNGVLSVTIPVSERAKPRKIEVQASADSAAITGSGSGSDSGSDSDRSESREAVSA